MSTVKFSLMVQVIERRADEGQGTFIDVSVSAWEDKERVSAIDIAHLTNIDVPEEADIDSAEQWAAVVSRVVAREIDQNFFDQLAAGQLHKREYFMSEVPGALASNNG